MKDPEVTAQSTAFSVIIPAFHGTNWHDVKAKMIALLNTRVRNCGIPLTYLVRETKSSWEDTEMMSNLQERRIVTKVHKGHTYVLDNRELFRILMNTFTSSTLDNIVQSHQRHNDGLAAWKAILANVEGANYASELKRQGAKSLTGHSLTQLRISLSKSILTNTSSPTNYTPLQCHKCLNGGKLINS